MKGVGGGASAPSSKASPEKPPGSPDAQHRSVDRAPPRAAQGSDGPRVGRRGSLTLPSFNNNASRHHPRPVEPERQETMRQLDRGAINAIMNSDVFGTGGGSVGTTIAPAPNHVAVGITRRKSVMTAPSLKKIHAISETETGPPGNDDRFAQLEALMRAQQVATDEKITEATNQILAQFQIMQNLMTQTITTNNLHAIRNSSSATSKNKERRKSTSEDKARRSSLHNLIKHIDAEQLGEVGKDELSSSSESSSSSDSEKGRERLDMRERRERRISTNDKSKDSEADDDKASQGPEASQPPTASQGPLESEHGESSRPEPKPEPKPTADRRDMKQKDTQAAEDQNDREDDEEANERLSEDQFPDLPGPISRLSINSTPSSSAGDCGDGPTDDDPAATNAAFKYEQPSSDDATGHTRRQSTLNLRSLNRKLSGVGEEVSTDELAIVKKDAPASRGRSLSSPIKMTRRWSKRVSAAGVIDNSVISELHENAKRSKGVIPVNSLFRSYWDLALVTFVLYELAVVPFDTSFHRWEKGPFFESTEVVVYICFCLDLFLNFFTTFYIGEQEITSHLHIADR